MKLYVSHYGHLVVKVYNELHMPSSAPPSGPKIKKILLQLGAQIRARRKGFKVSAVGASEAAGISRMTLNRIERGEASVTMGAYLSVISVLGLEPKLTDPKLSKSKKDLPKLELNFETKIKLSEFPQLKKIAWQIKESKTLSPQEALNLYERNWRHVDFDKMKIKERKLIESILKFFGKERLLV